jgi:hypothetical protein
MERDLTLEHAKYSIKTELLQKILQEKFFPETRKIELSYFDSGLKGIVLNCNLGNGKEYIVRCIRDPLKARKLLKIHDLLAQSHHQSSKLLLKDFSFSTYSKIGAFIALEEKIKGSLVQDVCFNTTILVQIAQNLAKLHGITNRRWTRKSLLPHYGSYFKYCMRGIVRNLERWFKKRIDFNRTQRRLYYNKFLSYKPTFDSITHFNLLHFDPAPDNHIISNGNIYCIDFEESRFGIFWTDYLFALEYYCRRGKSTREKFHEAYFSTLKDPDLEVKLHLEKFFQGKYCLSILSSYQRKLKNNQGNKKKIQRLYEWYENHLLNLLGE